MIRSGYQMLGRLRSSSQKRRGNNNVSSNKFPNTRTISNTGPSASTRSKVAQNYLEENGLWTRTRSKIAQKYLAAEIKANIEKNYLIATTSGISSRKNIISNGNILVSNKNPETLSSYIIKNIFNTLKLRNLLYSIFFVFICFIGFVGYTFLDVMFLAE